MDVLLHFHVDEAEEARVAGELLAVVLDVRDLVVHVVESDAEEGVELLEHESKLNEHLAELVEGHFILILQVLADPLQAFDRVPYFE